MKTAPSLGCSKPAMRRSVVVLPTARGAEQREEHAARDRQGEVANGEDVAVGFADAAEEDGSVGVSLRQPVGALAHPPATMRFQRSVQAPRSLLMNSWSSST